MLTPHGRLQVEHVRVQRPAPSVPTERVGRPNRTVRALIVLGVLFIALASLKPWNAGSGATHEAGPPTLSAASVPHGPAAATAGVVVPTPLPSLELLLRRRECQDTDAWRIVTTEQSGQLWSSGLLPVTPVLASGPRDPAIVAQPFRAGQLFAIGYCVPLSAGTDAAAAEARVTIWQQLPGGRPRVLRNLRVLDPGLASIGEVYLGAGSASHPLSWPDGRYVFEAQGAGPGGVSGWFALAFSSSGLALAVP
jgi:hypothetical protein